MTDTTTDTGFPYGFVVALAIAAMLYLFMAMMLADARHGDAAGRGMAMGFGVVVAVLLWIVLAVLLLLARKAIPGWAMACLVVLVPLSAIAAAVAIGLHSESGGLVVAVPYLLPPLVAFYAAWGRFPGLQAMLTADAASGAIVAVLALGTVAPFVAAYA